jgi:cell cycle checkpoint control protein RAD9A
MSLALELRFTDPAAPLFIDVEGDAVDILFVISTSQVPGVPTTSSQRNSQVANSKKRDREQSANETPRIKKPMKAVQPAGPETLQSRSNSNSRSGSHIPGSMPPPSFIPNRGISQMPQSQEFGRNRVPSSFDPPPSMRQKEPLFLPSSQMSAADEEVLRATGLGVESMDAHELADLLEGEGEEVDFSFASQQANDMEVDEQDSFELVEEGGLSATQSSHNGDKVWSSLLLIVSSKHLHLQMFQPLFED